MRTAAPVHPTVAGLGAWAIQGARLAHVAGDVAVAVEEAHLAQRYGHMAARGENPHKLLILGIRVNDSQDLLGGD